MFPSMAIISEIPEEKEEEEEPSSTDQTDRAYPGSDEEVLSQMMDRKGGPIHFLEFVMDCLRRRTDVFKSRSVTADIMRIVNAAKAEADAAAAAAKEDAKRKEKLAERKIISSCGGEGMNKKAVEETRAYTEKKVEEVESSETDVDSGEQKRKEEDVKADSNVRVPNAGNGLDLETYSWTQTLQEVSLTVPVPQGIKSRFVVCEIKKNHLKVGLKGKPLTIDGDLFLSVKTDDCFWTIEDSKYISVLLTKQNQTEWWKCLVKEDPEIDTEKVVPETRKLSDLDPEARTTVEKVMFNQRQKQMGLLKSKEMPKQELLEDFMAQHPEMVFSKAKFA